MKVVLNTNNIYSKSISSNKSNQAFGSTNNFAAQGVTEINRASQVFNKRNITLATLAAAIVALGYYILHPQEEKVIHPSRYKA